MGSVAGRRGAERTVTSPCAGALCSAKAPRGRPFPAASPAAAQLTAAESGL